MFGAVHAQIAGRQGLIQKTAVMRCGRIWMVISDEEAAGRAGGGAADHAGGVHLGDEVEERLQRGGDPGLIELAQQLGHRIHRVSSADQRDRGSGWLELRSPSVDAIRRTDEQPLADQGGHSIRDSRLRDLQAQSEAADRAVAEGQARQLLQYLQLQRRQAAVGRVPPKPGGQRIADPLKRCGEAALERALWVAVWQQLITSRRRRTVGTTTWLAPSPP